MKEQTTTIGSSSLTIKPTRCFISSDKTKKTRAYIDISVGGCFTIKGFKVVEGNNGLFVSMPQQLNKNKWWETVKCASDEIKDEVEHIVLKYYKSEAKVTKEGGA